MIPWQLSHIEHAGFTVPDLDDAVRFFIDHLGAEELYRSSREPGPFLRTTFAAPKDASFRLSMLRVSPNLNIELFEWSTEWGRKDYPHAFEVGGNHLCLYVDDVDAALEYFAAVPGVATRGGANTVAAGPVAGSRWGYVQTPWGMQLEFVNRGAVHDGPQFAPSEAFPYQPMGKRL